MTLFQMAIAWGVGILFAASLRADGPFWIAPLCASLLILSFFGRDKFLRRVGLCVLAAGLGMARLASVQPHFGSQDLATYNDQGYAVVVGTLIDEPEVRDTSIRLRIAAESLERDQTQHTVQGLTLVYADRQTTERFRYGDRLRISGLPQTPGEFDTFSFRDYLARSGVYTVIFRPKITYLEANLGDPLTATLFDFKDRARALIDRLLSNPQSALLRGILLGDDSAIAPDLADAFRQTNTTHLIAISGSNIAVVVALLMTVLGRQRRKILAVVLTLFGVLLYTLFVGAGPSVLRAAIMASLAIIAGKLSRPAHGLTMLAASVWGITLLNPLLIYDLGLILSASATLGLILYSRYLTRLTEKLISRWFASTTARQITGILSDTILISLIAQVTTLPIILLINDGQFSPLSLPINMLVAPAQPWIMALGLPMLAAGAVFFPLGQLLGWLVALPVGYTVSIIRAGAALSPGLTLLISPDAAIGYYVVLFGATLVLTEPPKPRRRWLKRVQLAALPALGLAVAVLVLIGAVIAARPDGKLHVWFLNVGEGSAVLIQTPNGARILIDGGENPTRLLTALGDHLPFYQHSLDLLIVTQPKTVTAGALPTLLEQYHVSLALTNGQNTFSALTEALQRANVQTLPVIAGYRAQIDEEVVIECLAPATIPTPEAKPDDVPLVLRLRYGDAAFIFTSEISEKGMSAISETIKTQNWAATILELASNGSAKANPTAWLAAIRPQIAVAIAEAGSRTAQPDESVLSALGTARIFRTDRDGSIEIATDKRLLWVQTEKR